MLLFLQGSHVGLPYNPPNASITTTESLTSSHSSHPPLSFCVSPPSLYFHLAFRTSFFPHSKTQSTRNISYTIITDPHVTTHGIAPFTIHSNPTHFPWTWVSMQLGGNGGIRVESQIVDDDEESSSLVTSSIVPESDDDVIDDDGTERLSSNTKVNTDVLERERRLRSLDSLGSVGGGGGGVMSSSSPRSKEQELIDKVSFFRGERGENTIKEVSVTLLNVDDNVVHEITQANKEYEELLQARLLIAEQRKQEQEQQKQNQLIRQQKEQQLEWIAEKQQDQQEVEQDDQQNSNKDAQDTQLSAVAKEVAKKTELDLSDSDGNFGNDSDDADPTDVTADIVANATDTQTNNNANTSQVTVEKQDALQQEPEPEPEPEPEEPPLRKPKLKVLERSITFETGVMARQAGGSVTVKCGGTVVLNTACCTEDAVDGVDFMPLRVDYQEKFSAFGKTVSGFVKREGRPKERDILVSRLIDRPLRPMFLNGYFNEVQLLSNVYSYDGSNFGDTLAICGCAAALHISNIPLKKPVAAVRIGRIDDYYVINPTRQEMKLSDTDLVIAGTRDSVLMIEGQCNFLTEEQIVQAIHLAQKNIAKICDAMDKLRDIAGTEKVLGTLKTPDEQLIQKVQDLATGLDEALVVSGKFERATAVSQIQDKVYAQLKISEGENASINNMMVEMAWKAVRSKSLRSIITTRGIRPDGRDTVTVRPINIIPNYLPGPHGSCLFTRGETQSLAVATLGDEAMAQRYETLDGEGVQRFYLQYTFPPFSVNEVGRFGAPGRREIGHGKLAERALEKILPPKETFPYVIRVESNILESNGSSSMASVCAGCLALMDAGVPIKSPAAGVAMGLILEENSYTILTDILGMEDALGDMDFKVAGDQEGITALQMDIKVEGISQEIMKAALHQAKQGRLHILQEMNNVLPRPRDHVSEKVPKMKIIQISIKKIGTLIGPGGKTIKSIVEELGGDDVVQFNIGQDGAVSIASTDTAVIEEAVRKVEQTVFEIEVGEVVVGKVTEILPFGAIITIGGAKEAFLHIGDMQHERTEEVSDVLKIDDLLEVKVTEIKGNSVRVSRKALLPLPEGFEKGKKKKVKKLKVGDIKTGTVVKILPFGAFLDIGDAKDCFLHISDIDHGRTEEVTDVLNVGDAVEVKVIEANGKNVKVSRKEMLEKPMSFKDQLNSIAVGNVYTGIVNKISDRGAHVQILSGMETWLHISEVSETKVKNMASILTVGQEIEVVVISKEKSSVKVSRRNIPKRQESVTKEESMVNREIVKDIDEDGFSEAVFIKDDGDSESRAKIDQEKKNQEKKNQVKNQIDKPKISRKKKTESDENSEDGSSGSIDNIQEAEKVITD